MTNKYYWSRCSGFYYLPLAKRRELLKSLPLGLDQATFIELDQGLSFKHADLISENVIGTFSLPLSVAPNFIIDQKPVIVPMVSEEPSVVAACSKMAKIVGESGGFLSKVDLSLMKGQIQLYGFSDIDALIAQFEEQREQLLLFANSCCKSLLKRGGGVKSISCRAIAATKSFGPMLLIEPVVDVKDAMGANLINTLLEALASKIEHIFGAKVGLKILSNLADLRLARAYCSIPLRLLATDRGLDDGQEVAQRMLLAQALADNDIYRACTHNKGILNGIDAVAIATGNDFRAIEAGAHAYAAKTGAYKPLSSMNIDLAKKELQAELCLPLAVGVVGGNIALHKGVEISLSMLGDFAKTAQGLSSVMVSVGLAQGLAALFALCSDGIQKGHMKLHKKKLGQSPNS